MVYLLKFFVWPLGMRTSPLARAGPSDLGGSRAPRGIRAQGLGNHIAEECPNRNKE